MNTELCSELYEWIFLINKVFNSSLYFEFAVLDIQLLSYGLHSLTIMPRG